MPPNADATPRLFTQRLFHPTPFSPNAFSPNAFSPRPAPMPPTEYATRAHLPVLQRELGMVHATSHRRAPAHRRAVRAPATAHLP
eukprot:COSAG01_NODE_13416_length_1588_cov_2.366017_1_plen_84_part_10